MSSDENATRAKFGEGIPPSRVTAVFYSRPRWWSLIDIVKRRTQTGAALIERNGTGALATRENAGVRTSSLASHADGNRAASMQRGRRRRHGAYLHSVDSRSTVARRGRQTTTMQAPPTGSQGKPFHQRGRRYRLASRFGDTAVRQLGQQQTSSQSLTQRHYCG